MYTSKTRPLKEGERAHLKRSSKPLGIGCGLFGIALLCVPVAIVLLFGFIGSFFSPEAESRGRWIGGIVTLPFAVALAMFLWLTLKTMRTVQGMAAQDLHDGLAEEFQVSDARLIEIEALNENEPIFAFDIGPGKLLVLQGPWLRDPFTFCETPISADPDEVCVNDLSPPLSFPNSEFTIVRFPHLGVFRIYVSGEYRHPAAVVGAMKREYEFGNLEILDGNLDDIAGSMEREHARRKNLDS
jgi:hypothetical protein